jgi:hypothetical protein
MLFIMFEFEKVLFYLCFSTRRKDSFKHSGPLRQLGENFNAEAPEKIKLAVHLSKL